MIHIKYHITVSLHTMTISKHLKNISPQKNIYKNGPLRNVGFSELSAWLFRVAAWRGVPDSGKPQCCIDPLKINGWNITSFIGKLLVPLGWYPSCLTLQRALQKGIYHINTHYIRCIWGWLLRVPSQGYHHFPYDSWWFFTNPFEKNMSLSKWVKLMFIFTSSSRFGGEHTTNIWNHHPR